jgi:hypothetical protein
MLQALVVSMQHDYDESIRTRSDPPLVDYGGSNIYVVRFT